MGKVSLDKLERYYVFFLFQQIKIKHKTLVLAQKEPQLDVQIQNISHLSVDWLKNHFRSKASHGSLVQVFSVPCVS